MPRSRTCSSEVQAEDCIAVTKQVKRELVTGKGLPQLLPRPLGGRVSGYMEVKNATTIMGQHQKHVKHVQLLAATSMPILSSSPWMGGAPQPGFSRHILRIRSRTWRAMVGRPGWPHPTFQVQNSRKP